MRRILSSIVIIVSLGFNVLSQDLPCSVKDTAARSPLNPDIGIILYSNDSETVWNAFRFANFSETKGDNVTIFLIGKGVEAPAIENADFDIKQKIEDFLGKGGTILACGTCLNLRDLNEGESIVVATLNELYTLVKSSKIVLTF